MLKTSSLVDRRPSSFVERENLKLLCCNPFRAYIWPQRLRNDYAPVGLLIVLHNRHPGATHGQSAPIQIVQELRLILSLGALTNVGAPRLIGFETRSRGNLGEDLMPRQRALTPIGCPRICPH